MSTRHPLFLYNQMILRAALEKAAGDKQATGSQRQIGNCGQVAWTFRYTTPTARTGSSRRWMEFAAIKSKQDLAGVLAFLHLNYQGEWNHVDCGRYSEDPTDEANRAFPRAWSWSLSFSSRVKPMPTKFFFSSGQVALAAKDEDRS